MMANHRQLCLAAGLGQVRPAVVVGVKADVAGPDGFQRKGVIEQLVQRALEVRPRRWARVGREGNEARLHGVGHGSPSWGEGLRRSIVAALGRLYDFAPMADFAVRVLINAIALIVVVSFLPQIK